MKKLFLAAVAVMMTAFSVNAQVKVESPHPDLSIQVKRCAYASGTVVVDMLVTNFGADEEVSFFGGSYLGGSKNSIAYDDEGNVYSFHSIEGNLGVVMPRDVPIKYRITVKDVDSNASKFSVLKIHVESRGAMRLNSSKMISIRNLEWVK